jgi:hypothetical protein
MMQDKAASPELSGCAFRGCHTSRREEKHHFLLSASFVHGPDDEVVDGIGVPPDTQVQPDPTALTAGNDPVLARTMQAFS